jgi:N-acetylmuramoyl-L-alanine amidase
MKKFYQLYIARNEAAYHNSNNAQVSYHVAIDDKEAVQLIPFNRTAWHAGDGMGNGNMRSIGIEICYSMDNGYSGPKSARYKAAEENAALYIAFVLKQYGWGMDRLKRHYDWSGKDCPHKMHATNSYQAFRNRVQAHLNALNKGTVASKPSAKPAGKKKSVNTGGWKKNKYGTQYMKKKGTWKNGSTRVMSRFGSPFRSAPEGGWAKPGWKCNYDEIVRQDGHIWLGYTVSGKRKYIPVKTWNSKTGEVGKDWGTFS